MDLGIPEERGLPRLVVLDLAVGTLTAHIGVGLTARITAFELDASLEVEGVNHAIFKF